MSDSKQQWTPGPWEQNKYGEMIGSNGKNVVLGSSGFSLACGEPNEEWDANGLLAKAAPELVEAMSSMCSMYESLCDVMGWGCPASGEYRAARAALAKAGAA